MNELPCKVCPHTTSSHIMADSVKKWRGDYCTVCKQVCRAEA